MLGLQACIALRLISLNCEQNSACIDCHKKNQLNAIQEEGNSKLSGEGNGDAKEKLLEKYPKCFRGVGLFSGVYHIDLKQDAEPVIHPPRRDPESMKDAVEKELKRMIEIDVIEKVDWVNSVVYVTKPSGELRICLDPKDLNNCVRRPHHYTQVLEDILPQLQGASVFSIQLCILNSARSWFWNVKLDDVETTYDVQHAIRPILHPSSPIWASFGTGRVPEESRPNVRRSTWCCSNN
ncbi:hypothetical protein NP493_301g03014 [Ridgeia piscesae]|uniref:Uncharacterized protein n=1 Tax=Ridgeia piscesae TaxID=27915 RepID=A0AAD9L688_RIDPI|nr:hypothetical protein NP493_301g03014 [Ridgeia piscesae]